MKHRIDENRKVTLTLGQLKKLVKEGRFADKISSMDKPYKEIDRKQSLEGYIARIETQKEDIKEAAELLDKIWSVFSLRKDEISDDDRDNFWSEPPMACHPSDYEDDDTMYGIEYDELNHRFFNTLTCLLNGGNTYVTLVNDGWIIGDRVRRGRGAQKCPNAYWLIRDYWDNDEVFNTIRYMAEHLEDIFRGVERVYENALNTPGFKRDGIGAVDEGRFAVKLKELERIA